MYTVKYTLLNRNRTLIELWRMDSRILNLGQFVLKLRTDINSEDVHIIINLKEIKKKPS